MPSPLRVALLSLLLGVACAAPEGTGLSLTPETSGAEIVFDIEERPFPNIPLPNDFATRFDASSPTKKRLNASRMASTAWERATRDELAKLDGWGTYAPMSVAFTKPLDLLELHRRHTGDDYDQSNDALYVIDVTPDSPEFCNAVPLDVGNGNFPANIEDRDFFPNDPRGATGQLLFEEVNEDLNRNGRLDEGEDSDMDGVLDRPNTLVPGDESVMLHYERETNTLIFRPLMPMRERTTYAVVLTRRLLDEDGKPVKSPFRFVNHTAQTSALSTLPSCLPKHGLGLDDVAFTWSFTTQSISSYFVTIRDGLRGLGPLSRLATEYPAKLTDLDAVRDDPLRMLNVRIVPGEQLVGALSSLLPGLLGADADSPQVKSLIDGFRAIDFFVTGAFESPQFFPRQDTEGKPLPLHQQTWKLDPATGAIAMPEGKPRREKVAFWLAVPKGRRGPAPIAIAGHGYGSNKLEGLFYAGLFARQGIAAIATDCPSHGLGFGDLEVEAAKGLFASKGLAGLFQGLKRDRAFDQTGDGVADSGADYWTAYAVHTRDMVRQSTVDYLRLVHVLESFDGANRWDWDVNRDGEKDLAGDFDGDGVIDIGKASVMTMGGGSLGGIMSALVGGTEPRVGVVVPISAGAGFGEVGKRAAPGGVKEAVSLRTMGPLLVTLKNRTGGLDLVQIAPSGNDRGQVTVGPVTEPLSEGDTAVVTNLTTGEYRCARVQKDGLLRVAVSSDEGNPLRLDVYPGVLPTKKGNGCTVPAGAEPRWSTSTFSADVTWQGRTLPKDSPLVALGDGFGLRRGTPEMRRFIGFAQVLLDAADPVNFAPNYQRRILEYGTGERVRTRALIMNTVGDPVVPVAAGTALARAAGYLDLASRDARYNKTVNQVLVDSWIIEGVNRTSPFRNSRGQPVLMDIENLSSTVPVDDGFDVPRLNPPLRHVFPSDVVGGTVGVLYPMPNPTGRHGFDLPDPKKRWDDGTYLVNMLARYLASQGTSVSFDGCQHTSSCSWIAPTPAAGP
ncbi:MAG: hypothetical protein SFW67_04620 [Myxococcaceae bacterium]|nr:hypothetical protein [Myxococcaceae bacterium]